MIAKYVNLKALLYLNGRVGTILRQKGYSLSNLSLSLGAMVVTRLSDGRSMIK